MIRGTYLNHLVFLIIGVTVTLAALTLKEEDEILRKILMKYADKYQPAKRGQSAEEFNNCPDKDQPFPCKTQEKCIALKHICDGNYDCPDGYDEDESVCIAYQRVPSDDLKAFVKTQARWMVNAFFKDTVKSPDDLNKVGSALALSPNIDDFQRRLKLSNEDAKKFHSALEAVRAGDKGALEALGMPATSWNEVKYIFGNLITSGFL